MKIVRIQAPQQESNRMTTANKLTRNAPGLWIEETLFTCLARFFRHSKSNPENFEELLRPIILQFDKDEITRLVELCTDETTRFEELIRLYKLTQGESDALALAVMMRQKYDRMDQRTGRLDTRTTSMRAAFLGINQEEYPECVPRGWARGFNPISRRD